MAYMQLDGVFSFIGLKIEPSKTELMHFAAKDQSPKRGHKPICFPVLFSSLPSVSLISS